VLRARLAASNNHKIREEPHSREEPCESALEPVAGSLGCSETPPLPASFLIGELALPHQAEAFGVCCAQEKIQKRTLARIPITPAALPVGPAEIAHALTQNLDRAACVFATARIEDKFRTAG
jgi:hypothetical protein